MLVQRPNTRPKIMFSESFYDDGTPYAPKLQVDHERTFWSKDGKLNKRKPTITNKNRRNHPRQLLPRSKHLHLAFFSLYFEVLISSLSYFILFFKIFFVIYLNIF